MLTDEHTCDRCGYAVAASRWKDHLRWHNDNAIRQERQAQRATAAYIDAWLRGRVK